MKLEEVGQVFVDGRLINVNKVSNVEKLDNLYDKTLKEENKVLNTINKIVDGN